MTYEYSLSSRGVSHPVLVDDEDAHFLNDMTVFLHTSGYVVCEHRRPPRRIRSYLHRLILNPPKKAFCDHINGDKLDNRRCNLRIVSATVSNFNTKLRKDNTHGFRGISLHTSGLWQARITVHGTRHNLGYFKTPEEAHAVYRKAAEGFGFLLRPPTPT